MYNCLQALDERNSISDSVQMCSIIDPCISITQEVVGTP